MPASSVPAYIHESVRALPVLPTAVSRLLALTRELDVDFGEIAQVIETDQTLTARVLRAANSPLYSVSRRITTLRQATVLLGTDAVVNLALGVSVMSMQSRLHDQLPIDASAFGRHSIAVALAARRLAEQQPAVNPGEAFVAGLLHDIGKLVLLMHHRESYARLMLRAHEGEAPLHVLEDWAYNVDHALVGHALCLHWNLPPAFAGVMPGTLGALVGIANDLVNAFGLGDGGSRYLPLAEAADLAPDALDADWLQALLDAMPQETHAMEEALGRTTEPAAAPAGGGRRVLLRVTHPAERACLQAVLASMGCVPVTAGGGDGAAVPTAVVADVPVPVDGLPLFDYATWRSTHAVDGTLHAPRLREALQRTFDG